MLFQVWTVVFQVADEQVHQRFGIGPDAVVSTRAAGQFAYEEDQGAQAGTKIAILGCRFLLDPVRSPRWTCEKDPPTDQANGRGRYNGLLPWGNRRLLWSGRLFQPWCRLLDLNPDRAKAMGFDAHRAGLLNLRALGEVVELSFPRLAEFQGQPMMSAIDRLLSNYSRRVRSVTVSLRIRSAALTTGSARAMGSMFPRRR